jgi:Leucine-rich repeat (LRR) protein
MSTPTEPATPTPPRRRRKPLRLTLGALMILVLAIGGPMGWIAHRTRVQREAVAAVLKAGGYVGYNGQRPRQTQVAAAPGPGPRWLRNLLGADAFDTVTFVGISAERCDDRLMARIGDLDRLEQLNIQGRPLPPGLTTEGKSRIRNLTRLESFVIQGPMDTNGFLPFVGGQRRLRKLWLARSSATDDDLARIGRLTGMEDLDLDGSKVTDKGFAALANLTKMKRLTLGKCIVTDLSPVSGMTNLERLILGDGNFFTATSEGLRTMRLDSLRGKSKLIDVSLGNIPTDDAGLGVVASLPALIGFSASGRGITEKGLAVLSSAPMLRDLGLRETSIRDLRPFGPPIASLRFLDLTGTPVTDDGLAPLAGTSRMLRLLLSRTDIGDAGLAHLGAMSKLNDLRLEGTRVTDAGLARLSGLASLRNLWLRRTRITGEGFSRLTALKQLAILDLSKTALTDDGLATVAKLRSGATLILRDTPITDQGLGRLKGLTGLTSLTLGGTRVTDAGLAHLAGLPRLASLGLSEPGITDAGLVQLEKLLPLKRLHVHCTRVTDAGLARLKAERPSLEIVTTPWPEVP